MAKIRTITTIARYFARLAATSLGIKYGRPELESIFNYVKISDNLSTSGQPTEEQFGAIAGAGFDTVINLLPREKENALKNEAEVVRGLGLDYTHIPVDFSAPTAANLGAFTAAMQANQGKRVWVHCAVNARVSIFVARYRAEVLGEPLEQAREHIAQVWEPFGAWPEFLESGGAS
ncbi:MAG: protein tyrosine phosphatase family protein [Pseudomonadota bacterium]